MDDTSASWVDYLSAINAIAVGWYTRLSDPAPTTGATVTGGTTGITATVSPAVLLVIGLIGLALVLLVRR